VRLWVLGDSWTDPRTYPWHPLQGWPQLVAARLGLGLVNSGVSGSGYASTGGLPNFPGQAAQGRGAGADVVLVWGSLNDPNKGYAPADTLAGARATYGLIGRLCPDAPLIVFGPQWYATAPTALLLSFRDVVRQVAGEVGAVFVDPSSWLVGRPDLLQPDNHPTPDGDAFLADRVAAELGHVLPVDPQSWPRTSLSSAP
jgi:lysophospholipase L1-like esterase